MIISVEEAFIREHMDLSDRDTLKEVSYLMEANKDSQLIAALTGELYEKIQQKATKIDYSSISRSRGDITKIENYNTLMSTVDIVHGIVEEYRQKTDPVDTVISAIENIKNRKQLFTKAFAINASLPIIVYNNIVLAIVSSISFLIATCIEYIKNPGSETFDMALDAVAYNKTKDHLLFESLYSFNEACACGELDSSLNTIIRKRVSNESAADVSVYHDRPFLTDENIDQNAVIHDDTEEEIHEDFIFNITKAVIFAVKLLINCIRSLIYYFFNTKQKISDYFALQAQLLEMNAYKVQMNSNIDNTQRKKIYDKQMKIATKFHNWANKFNIDHSMTKKAVEKQIDDDSTKYRIDDLNAYNPNEETQDPYADSVLF